MNIIYIKDNDDNLLKLTKYNDAILNINSIGYDVRVTKSLHGRIITISRKQYEEAGETTGIKRIGPFIALK